jgi:Protein of unknown function (DUF5132)
MALLEDVTKGGFTTVLIGVGAAIVAPTVIPALATGLRPLAKALVKGGVTLYDSVKETVAEAGEQFNDLVAEVRSEMAESGDDERTTRTTTTARRQSEQKD